MEGLENEVVNWLRSGRDDAKDIVDLPWNVKEIGPHKYLAEHPKMPFQLLLIFTEDFVRLVVPFGLETISLETADRMKVYRILLKLNDQINLMKFVLSDINDNVYLRVDLDRKTLGKEEFNDALTSLLVGMLTGVSALGLEEEFQQELLDRIVGMILERLEKGASRDELMKFLTVKVGMTAEDAESLLDQVFKAKGSIEDNESDVGYF